HRFEAEQLGQEFGDGPEYADVSVVVLVNPQAGETDGAFDNRQVVRCVFAVSHFNQSCRFFARGHYQCAIRFGKAIDRLQAVPSPGLDALAQGVVHGNGNVHFLRLILRHALFERNVVGGDDGESLGGYAIALRAVAISAEGNARLAFMVRRQYDRARDVSSQSFLEYSAVNYFNSEEPAHWTI